MKGNGFKISIIGACLLLAGFLFYRNLFGAPEVPEEFRNQTHAALWFKCTKCGEEVSINPEQLDPSKINEVPLPGENMSGIRTAPRTLQYVECPTCKTMTALSGNQCGKHKLVFYSFNPDGTRGKCQKCVDEAEGRTEG